ncbi:hypothetical protein FQA39_LY15008 [Lamprigera yunnana]|nr:hypothetical protein FQA39_LY15008 [Lamprigera yunnana]
MLTSLQVLEFQKISDDVQALGDLTVKMHHVGEKMGNVRVNLGIDEDLQMILEMDPSIIDYGNTSNLENYPALKLATDHVTGRPPKTGGPPNLKTATPLSRTQLKQQLMREQALQEQERREAREKEQRASQETENNMESAMRVPYNIAVDVPPQVLQVKTKLENPTRYHVMQKQKSQVQQYLNTNLSRVQENVYQPQTQSAPGFVNNYDSMGRPCGVIAPSAPSYGYNQVHPAAPSLSPNCDAPAMSPAVSSGTSTSGVSFTNL